MWRKVKKEVMGCLEVMLAVRRDGERIIKANEWRDWRVASVVYVWTEHVEDDYVDSKGIIGQ